MPNPTATSQWEEATNKREALALKEKQVALLFEDERKQQVILALVEVVYQLKTGQCEYIVPTLCVGMNPASLQRCVTQSGTAIKLREKQ